MNRGAPEERRVAGWILYLRGTPRRGVEFHAPAMECLVIEPGQRERTAWILD
jgi:hypothetical protein